MTAIQKSLPKWILLVSGILAVIEIMVSISLVVAPQSVVETADLNADGVAFLIYMWAVRQFALGFILAFATVKRSMAMLTIAYVFLLVMFAGDALIGIWQKDNALVMAALVMAVIAGTMLSAINKKRYV